MSHYGRLFAHIAKPARSPLENFLTEAIADLLNRMPASEVGALLRHAFAGIEHPDFELMLESGSGRWETQVAVPGGIADLVLWIGSIPALVIENKTWGSFRDHSIDGAGPNQITTYCDWLATKSGGGTDCAILLLTGTTAAPVGFGEKDGAYAVTCRGQVTWAAVGRWLTARVSQPVGAGEPMTWQVLAMELVEFLKEMKLSSEFFTPSDISAAHLFVPAMDRWQSTFHSIWSAAETAWSPFMSKIVSGTQVSSEGGMIWQWRYANASAAPIRSYIGLGFRFPDQSKWYHGIGLPQTPHFLLLISTDVGFLRSTRPLPKGWVSNDDEGEFLTAKSLGGLDDELDSRMHQLVNLKRIRCFILDDICLSVRHRRQALA